MATLGARIRPWEDQALRLHVDGTCAANLGEMLTPGTTEWAFCLNAEGHAGGREAPEMPTMGPLTYCRTKRLS